MERVEALDFADETVVARLHVRGGAFVLVGVDVEILRLDREAAEQTVKFLRPFYFGDAGVLRRFVFAEFVAFPKCVLLVWLAKKKYLAHFLIVCIGEKNEQRLLLLDAGEVKQIAVCTEGIRGVRIGRENVVRIDDCDGLGREQRCEPGAVFDVKFRVERLVAHRCLLADVSNRGKFSRWHRRKCPDL